MRGKQAKAREGHIPSSFHTTYGYDYVKAIRGERQAERFINETEAVRVRQIFEWLVNDSLATCAIRDRLMANNAPTKHGVVWRQRTILAILKNPAYTGKTYASTSLNHCKRRRAKEEWVGLPVRAVSPAHNKRASSAHRYA